MDQFDYPWRLSRQLELARAKLAGKKVDENGIVGE
jgi:hypothetical protein